jgi:hypothetical protein
LPFDRKQRHLVPEDRGHTWALSIEMPMGERNKIENAIATKKSHLWDFFALLTLLFVYDTLLLRMQYNHAVYNKEK